MPKYSAPARPIAIPQSRLARLAGLGSMATGIAGSMAVSGAQQLARGERPAMQDLLLTPGNLTRVADQLARMRGAAMKVGQLMSMDAGEVLPKELSDILARLRADADYMPPKQLKSALTAAWGPDWHRKFARFDIQPIAAASIGQVHRVLTKDGRDLAIKVQYPGVAGSIDSDVRNVLALIKMSGLAPVGIDLDPLMAEAAKQLHEEADYAREGQYLRRFGALLDGAKGFQLPQLHEDLTTDSVLAMSYIEGDPIETLETCDQETRDRLATRLLDLLFKEVFSFGVMQSDPNFANYRYNGETDDLILLDFGATREIAPALADDYRALLRAGIAQDRPGVHDAALRIGFYGPETAPHHQATVLDMIEISFEGLHQPPPFDFGDPAMMSRIREAGMQMAMDRSFVHVPPIETIFLQRKFAGMFLLAARLKARVDIKALVAPHL